MKNIFLNTIMIFAFVCCAVFWGARGEAQPFVVQHPAESGFLIELAQKMVVRGEYDEAQSILDKMLEQEPDNPAIKALLNSARGQKLSKPEPSRPIIRPSDIAGDITNIQRSILRYERRNRDSEFLVRKLIHENDILYQTLSQRNQELVELRKKLFGRSDDLPAYPYSSLDLSNLHETNAIMNNYESELVLRDRASVARNEEIARILNEAGRVNEDLKDNGAAAQSIDTAPDAEEWEKSLKEKRGALIDKSLTIFEKSKNLSNLQEELQDVSGSLKEANARYADIVKEYDAKIQKLKEDWAQDKSLRQEEIYNLRALLVRKEKELERIQNNIAGQGPRLENLKEGLGQKDRKLADTDAVILSKDKEIANFKRRLVAKNEEIARGQKMIDERNATIAFAQNKTADLRRRVVDIHQSLDEGGRALEELKGLVEDFKGRALARLPSSEAASLKIQIEDLKRQLDGLLETLQEKDRVIRHLNGEFATVQKAAGMKGQELSSERQTISELEGRLNAAEADKRTAQEDLQKGGEKLAMLVDNLSAYEKNADISSGRAADSGQKAYDLENKMDDQMVAFGQELRFLKETLAHKDQDIVDLKKELSAKQDQLKIFSDEIEKATGALNAQSLGRGQEATTPVMPQAQEPANPSVHELDWDPSDNDIYSLQKRLAILSKELKFAQDRLAVRTNEAGRLQQELREKEQELRHRKRLSAVIANAKSGLAQTARKSGVGPEDAAKLQKELDWARKDLALARQSLDSYKTSLEKIQRDARQKEKIYATAIAKSEKQNKEIADYKYRLREKDEQINAQQQALDHETQKTETLKRKLDQMTKASSGQRQQSGDQKQSILGMAGHLNNFEIRERDYKHQIDDIQGQLRTSYTMIKDGEARVEDLKRQLAQKEGRIAQLEARLMRAKGKTAAEAGDAKEAK